MLELSPEVKKSLEGAVDEARRMGHPYIGTEHLLLGLARLPDCTAMTLLRKRSISATDIRQGVHRILQESPSSTTSPEISQEENAIEHFSQRARQVLTLAHSEAEALHSADIGTEHLLLGLLLEAEGIASHALRELGLELQQLRQWVAESSTATDVNQETPELSAEVKKALEDAVDEARRMDHHYIGTEHLLLALTRPPDCAAMILLKAHHIRPEAIRREIRQLLENGPAQGSKTETSSLAQFDSSKFSLRVVIKEIDSDSVVGESVLPMTEVEEMFRTLSKIYHYMYEAGDKHWSFDVRGVGRIELSVEPNAPEE